MKSRDDDMDEEMREHLRHLAEQHLAAGMSPEEANRAAALEFGSVEALQADCRDQRPRAWLDSLRQDGVYGARLLKRSPGFAAAAIATLALGIGATTTVFSVVDGVLLRPLPYLASDRIVQVLQNRASASSQTSDVSFGEWKEQTRTFEALAKYRGLDAAVSGTAEPVQVEAAIVSADFFRVFGIAPERGRSFLPGEQRQGGDHAVIVSHGFWQRHLGGVESLSDLRLSFDNRVFAVVGVMPPRFGFPTGAELWLPSTLYPLNPSRTAHNWKVVGRVAGGLPISQAQAEMAAIGQRQQRLYGGEFARFDIGVIPLRDQIVGGSKHALLLLLGAVVFLLLVACANVANLLLAQMTARGQELTVRVALGASRSRLLRQTVTETLILGLAGAVLGAGLAEASVRTLLHFQSAPLPRLAEVAVDARALFVAVAVSLLTALALGFFVARKAGVAAEVDGRPGLATGSRQRTGDRRSDRVRSGLVSAQIALTLVLLAGAGLLGKSFYRLMSEELGFRQDDILVMELAHPAPRNEDEGARLVGLHDRLVERLRTLPGVVEVGGVNGFPLTGNLSNGGFVLMRAGEPVPDVEQLLRAASVPERHGSADFRVASEGYFRALGIPLVRGRMFDTHDGASSPPVAVINRALARERWPHEDPIGKLINFGGMDGDFRPFTVVGIVGDVRERAVDARPRPTYYALDRQSWHSARRFAVVMRTTGDPGTLFAGARRILRDLDPTIPPKCYSAGEIVSGALAYRRFVLLLLVVFGATALLLAAIGVYGVTAFAVATRTQEIGVRMALGARSLDVFRLVFSDGARQVVPGVAVGFMGALALTRVLRGLLYEVTASDPTSYLAAIMVLLAATFLALYLPARRAARLAPLVALRSE